MQALVSFENFQSNLASWFKKGCSFCNFELFHAISFSKLHYNWYTDWTGWTIQLSSVSIQFLSDPPPKPHCDTILKKHYISLGCCEHWVPKVISKSLKQSFQCITSCPLSVCAAPQLYFLSLLCLCVALAVSLSF